MHPSADLSSLLLNVMKPLAMHSPVQIASLAIFDLKKVDMPHATPKGRAENEFGQPASKMLAKIELNDRLATRSGAI